jgi:lambda family phage portal protein
MYAYGHSFMIDAERQNTFGGQMRMAVNHLSVDGEGVALSEWAADEPTRYKTRLRIVHPDRLSNPSGRINDRWLRGGVQHNDAGVPVAYWLREQHPVDYFTSGSYIWQDWARFTAWGRPQVFHWFDRQYATQTRGVSRFVASLKCFRAFNRFTDATIQKATQLALFSFFVSSSAGPEAVSESLQPTDLKDFNDSRFQHYDKHPVEFEAGARIPVLPYGDEIKNAAIAGDAAGFESFLRAIIRLIAASLGVTYEELTMDYSQTNYSSARAAMIHALAEVEVTQAILRDQLVKPFFVAWLEEAFDRGYIQVPKGAPDFYDAVDAYAEARWIGPKRGYIDPTKEILAAAARIEAGISTLEDECAEQGKYWEEVQDQGLWEELREKTRRQEMGLDPAPDSLAIAAQDTKNPFRTPADPVPDGAQQDGSEGAQPPQEDQRPVPPATRASLARPAPVVLRRPALTAIAGFADTVAHETFLNARL